jgi:hypothetical protein
MKRNLLLSGFKSSYNALCLDYVEEIKQDFGNFMVDFAQGYQLNTSWIFPIWIEPNQKMVYESTAGFSKSEFEIGGILLTLELEVDENDCVTEFKIIGHVNPEIWNKKKNVKTHALNKDIVVWKQLLASKHDFFVLGGTQNLYSLFCTSMNFYINNSRFI